MCVTTEALRVQLLYSQCEIEHVGGPSSIWEVKPHEDLRRGQGYNQTVTLTETV